MNSRFQRELTSLINSYNMEGDSDTPDFILAQYIQDCLTAWAIATSAREKWYGRRYVNPEYINVDGETEIECYIEPPKEEPTNGNTTS